MVLIKYIIHAYYHKLGYYIIDTFLTNNNKIAKYAIILIINGAKN